MRLVQVYNFRGNSFNCYVDSNHEDVFWATGKQFGTLLGYANPTRQVREHFRRLRKAKVVEERTIVDRLPAKETGKWRTRLVNFYGFRLLRQLCKASHQKSAPEVMEFLLNIANEMASHKGFAKTLFQETALTSDAKLSLAREYVRHTTGQDVLDFLPKTRFTPKEIADIIGTSPSAIGCIANRNGLKAPLGTNNIYGEWDFIGSTPCFYYNGVALNWFKNYLRR